MFAKYSSKLEAMTQELNQIANLDDYRRPKMAKASLYLKQDTIHKIDQIAEAKDMSASEVMRAILESGANTLSL